MIGTNASRPITRPAGAKTRPTFACGSGCGTALQLQRFTQRERNICVAIQKGQKGRIRPRGFNDEASNQAAVIPRQRIDPASARDRNAKSKAATDGKGLDHLRQQHFGDARRSGKAQLRDKGLQVRATGADTAHAISTDSERAIFRLDAIEFTVKAQQAARKLNGAIGRTQRDVLRQRCAGRQENHQKGASDQADEPLCSHGSS